jgi:uncharacterized membrane protein YphA (DoxX/SURF4 family)
LPSIDGHGYFNRCALIIVALAYRKVTDFIGNRPRLIGLATRWFTIPLMATMLVATFKVHIKNGWQAIADSQSPFPGPDIDGAMQRLGKARELLQEHGNYDWLTEAGSFVISNNGIERAITYFVMLLALFFSGPGKLSVDHLVAKFLNRRST